MINPRQKLQRVGVYCSGGKLAAHAKLPSAALRLGFEFSPGHYNENTDVTVSALIPASLITLTCDDATAPPPRRPDDVSLLNRVAQGDSRAARECIDRFGALVWSIARGLTCTRADTEKAVQEIFADVWRAAARYRPEQGSEEVFIAMIARRRLIGRTRRAAHRDPARATDDSHSLGPVDPSHRVCDEARGAREGIMLLRPELRTVLELGILQGLSHVEIAHRLQMPLDTVKTLMARGLIQLREFMGNRV